MHKAFLSLGSNVGDREKNLICAVEEIGKHENMLLIDVSNIYETEPVGYINQGRFLNMAVSVKTTLIPLELLKALQRVEKLLKRTREIHWGPRTIDIDILIYDDVKVSLPELVIPHPRMFERAFVLIPLKDISEDRYISVCDISDRIDKCSDKTGVILYKRLEITDLQK